jgi:hypothetical protein
MALMLVEDLQPILGGLTAEEEQQETAWHDFPSGPKTPYN